MTPYGPYTLSNDGRNYDIDAVFFYIFVGSHYEGIPSGCRAKRGSRECNINKKYTYNK